MRKRNKRAGQIDDFWPSKKPGRTGPNDSWCLTWYEAGQTRHKSLNTTDFNEACKLVAQHALTHGNSGETSRDAVQISAVIARYWEEHAWNIPSARTQREMLNKWNEYWGGKSVRHITRGEQDKFRKFLGEGRLAPSTIDAYLSAGRAALNWAVNHERLESAPKIWLTETEEDRRARPPMALPITPDLAAKLFDAVTERTLMTFLMLCMCTLARPGAIYDLRREQYDSDAGTLNMNPPNRRQTKKYRPILLVPPSLKPWLEAETDPKAFIVTKAGSNMKNLNASLKAVLQRANLPSNIAGYSFRHGLSRWMRKQKVPEEQIDHYLGHLPRGGAKMTRVYAPFEAEHCPEACEAIEKFVAEVRSMLKVSNLDDPDALDKVQEAKGRKANGTLSPDRKKALVAAISNGLGNQEAKRVFGISDPTYYRYKHMQFGRQPHPFRAKRVPTLEDKSEN